jgi:hypothetical protein
MMKIIKGLSWFGMGTSFQAWCVWVIIREVGISRRLGVWDLYWIPIVVKNLNEILFISWKFYNYIEGTLDFFRVITKKWEDNVSFVKATNLRLLREMFFKGGWGYISKVLNGEDMKLLVGWMKCLCYYASTKVWQQFASYYRIIISDYFHVKFKIVFVWEFCHNVAMRKI